MKQFMRFLSAGILATSLLVTSGLLAQQPAEKSNLYLVVGSEGPGFTSPQEAIQILEKGILPTFDAIQKLEKEGKIIVGGLPVGDRAMTFIMKASSNNEVDKLLRSLPAWGALNWKVTALESFAGRAAQEREALTHLKKLTMK